MKILITIAGGCLAGVYVKDAPAECEVALVDYDNEPIPEFDTWFSDGQTARHFLEQVPINPEHYRRIA